MHWLINSSGRALDLGDDIALLRLIGFLPGWLGGAGATPEGPARVGVMPGALRRVLDGVEPLRSDLLRALAAEGMPEDLTAAVLSRAADVLGGAALPEAYASLGCRLDER